MKKISLLIMIIPILLCGQFAKKGIVGSKFLSVGIGTRAVGMAEAYTAVGNDAEAVFWNPAGISLTKGTSILVNRIDHWDDIGINSVALTQQVGVAGVFGLFYSGLSTGEWEETTPEYPSGNNIYVNYSAFQTGLTYSRFLTDRFSFGVNLKMIREDYPDHVRNTHDATSFAMDFGGYYKTNFRDLAIGITIRDFGPEVTPHGTFVDYADGDTTTADERFDSYPLPTTFRGGISMTAFKTEQINARIAVDLIHPSDNLERFALGSEVSIMDILKLRAGYKVGGGVDESVNAFNFGVGISQKTATGGFEVGYSYTYGNVMPVIHRVSLLLGM